MSSEVSETLALLRERFKNPRVLVVRGEQRLSGFNCKALGYKVAEEDFPTFTDEEIIAAVAKNQGFAIPTGAKSDWLVVFEYDPCNSDSLGSEVEAQKWLAENLWRLEELETTIVESPRHGFHVWAIMNSGVFNPFDSRIDDWLAVVEEDPRIKPDTIHFKSVRGSDYEILPPSAGYRWISKSKLKRFD